jgi:hypothetical protein
MVRERAFRLLFIGQFFIDQFFIDQSWPLGAAKSIGVAAGQGCGDGRHPKC